MESLRLSIDDENILSHVGRYLPDYLTPAEKQDLVAGLKDFPEYFQYYLQGKHQTEALQGDVWDNFTVINFESGERKHLKGIVLSNSCDIDLSNPRSLPISITFAPIIKLQKLENLLLANKSKDDVTNIIKDIKSQRNTSFIYLPENTNVPIQESVAYLNDLRSMPVSTFAKEANKIITLTQQGFYLFILKLSMHFCRFQEGVSRF